MTMPPKMGDSQKLARPKTHQGARGDAQKEAYKHDQLTLKFNRSTGNRPL
jgi:hypothetical protein